MTHFKIILLLFVLALIMDKARAGKPKNKSKDKYLEGYYVDQKGNKIVGLISKDNLNWQFFYFKKQLGDTPAKIEASFCDSFVVDNKTFHTLSDINIKAIIWQTHSDRAFAELVSDGPVQLYSIHFEPAKQGYMKAVSLASNFTGGIAGQVVGHMAGRENVNYFLKRKTSTSYFRIQKNTFTDDMSQYFRDDASVSKKIQQGGDYTINNVELIVKEYNQDCVASHLTNQVCVF